MKDKKYTLVAIGDNKETLKIQGLDKLIVRRKDLKLFLGLINTLDVEESLNGANLESITSPENITVAMDLFNKFPEAIYALNSMVIFNFTDFDHDDLDLVDMEALVSIYIGLFVSIIGPGRISKFADKAFDSLVSKLKDK